MSIRQKVLYPLGNIDTIVATSSFEEIGFGAIIPGGLSYTQVRTSMSTKQDFVDLIAILLNLALHPPKKSTAHPVMQITKVSL